MTTTKPAIDMNGTTLPSTSLSNAPFPTTDHRMPVPDTSMLPGSEGPTPPVVNLLHKAVQGAHDTIDRFADTATPVARQLGERASAAEQALHAKTAQLRETRDEWADGVRARVRDNPLSCIAAAAVLGALIARLTR